MGTWHGITGAALGPPVISIEKYGTGLTQVQVQSHIAVPDGQNLGQTIWDSEAPGRVKNSW